MILEMNSGLELEANGAPIFVLSGFHIFSRFFDDIRLAHELSVVKLSYESTT